MFFFAFFLLRLRCLAHLDCWVVPGCCVVVRWQYCGWPLAMGACHIETIQPQQQPTTPPASSPSPVSAANEATPTHHHNNTPHIRRNIHRTNSISNISNVTNIINITFNFTQHDQQHQQAQQHSQHIVQPQHRGQHQQQEPPHPSSLFLPNTKRVCRYEA